MREGGREREGQKRKGKRKRGKCERRTAERKGEGVRGYVVVNVPISMCTVHQQGTVDGMSLTWCCPLRVWR